jgi:hypothetical protein
LLVTTMVRWRAVRVGAFGRPTHLVPGLNSIILWINFPPFGTMSQAKHSGWM